MRHNQKALPASALHREHQIRGDESQRHHKAVAVNRDGTQLEKNWNHFLVRHRKATALRIAGLVLLDGLQRNRRIRVPVYSRTAMRLPGLLTADGVLKWKAHIGRDVVEPAGRNYPRILAPKSLMRPRARATALAMISDGAPTRASGRRTNCLSTRI
jgi:hypothetical protein